MITNIYSHIEIRSALLLCNVCVIEFSVKNAKKSCVFFVKFKHLISVSKLFFQLVTFRVSSFKMSSFMIYKVEPRIYGTQCPF